MPFIKDSTPSARPELSHQFHESTSRTHRDPGPAFRAGTLLGAVRRRTSYKRSVTTGDSRSVRAYVVFKTEYTIGVRIGPCGHHRRRGLPDTQPQHSADILFSLYVRSVTKCLCFGTVNVATDCQHPNASHWPKNPNGVGLLVASMPL